MRAIFQKKGQKNVKKGKIFENLGKNVQNLKKYFEKGRRLRVIIARNKLLEKALFTNICFQYAWQL